MRYSRIITSVQFYFRSLSLSSGEIVCLSIRKFQVFSSSDDAANSMDQPVFMSASSHWLRDARPKLLFFWCGFFFQEGETNSK